MSAPKAPSSKADLTAGVRDSLNEWRVNFYPQLKITGTLLAGGAAFGYGFLGTTDPGGLLTLGLGNLAAFHLSEFVVRNTKIIPQFDVTNPSWVYYRMGGIFAFGTLLMYGMSGDVVLSSMYGAQSLASFEVACKVFFGPEFM